jgi:beta-fructofuranosidase
MKVTLTCNRPWYTNSTEIRFFHNGEGEVSFDNIAVHDGLYDAYPDRDN